MIRTQTGRVVYRRPRHFFTGRDLLRVARAIPAPQSFDDGFDRLMTIAEIYNDVVRGLMDWIFGDNVARIVDFVLNFTETVAELVLRSGGLDEYNSARVLKLLELIRTI